MKLLISAIFLFVCASAFGANPAYDAFRGAGGISVVSNPPNGTIIIDGSGVVASGTNSSIRASTNGAAVSAGATNINYTAGTNLVLWGTNIGSTAHINYRLSDSVSLGGSLLVNSNSTFAGNAQFDSPVGFSDEATFNGPITMPAGAAAGRVITSDAGGTFSWAAPSGGALATNANQFAANPTLTIKPEAVATNFNPWGVLRIDGAIFQTLAGTNINSFSASNFFGNWIQINAGNPATGRVLTSLDNDGNAGWVDPTTGSATNVMYGVGQTIFLDATFGNDSTATRTNTAKPFLQASNAVSAILSGDTLRVRGGTYLINPKTDPVTSLVGIRANTSAGLAITNRINFSISGEPGVIWQMSGRDFIGTTSACPMLTLSHCTNAVLENFTLSGIYTNGKVFQDFAIMLDQCENVTFRNLTFSNWMNQGITDHGVAGTSSFTSNRLHKFINLTFIRMGGTNQCTLGLDGAAISVNTSNSLFSGLTFIDCWREIEFYGFGSVRNNTFENCYTYGNRYQSFVFEALDMRDMQIIDCHAMGYSTDLYNVGAGIPEATWLDIWGGSNITLRGCSVGGMTGLGWSTAGHTPSYDLIDCTIQGCTFDDVSYRAIFALQYAGYPAKVERLRVVGNTFRNTLYPPITFTGNNSVVKDNEFWDCNTVNVPTGVIIAGYSDATYATNSTNITISGNNITSTDIAQRPFADGIMIWSECYSNVVFGNNVDGRFYRTNVHNVGIGTKTRPVNLVAPGSLLASDAAGDERAVVMGTGMAFDVATLTLSSSGGSGTPGGPEASIQTKHGSAFFGTNYFTYDITNLTLRLYDDVTSYVGQLALNAQSLIQFGDSTPLQFGVGGNTNWEVSALGHWLPTVTSVSDVGSPTKLVRTNYMTGFFMPSEARKNKQLRSVDSDGVGVWSPPAAGGNGNTAGANEAAPGAIQFARTNVTDGFMMNDSTNEFVYNYQTRTLTVPIINVQTQYANVLVLSNGLPAPGSNGQILYNGTNIITASPQNTLDEFGVMTISSLISPSVLLQDQVSYGVTNIFVGAVNSNQTVLLGKTANMMLSNSVTFTNFSTLASTRNATYLALIRVVASTNVNVNWGLGIGWDAGRVTTNANNPIWPVLTNGQMYVASWTGFGTNRILRLSLEQ